MIISTLQIYFGGKQRRQDKGMTVRHQSPAPAPASPGEDLAEGGREGRLSPGEAGDRNPLALPRRAGAGHPKNGAVSRGVLIIPRKRDKKGRSLERPFFVGDG
jgi:hypothetical protein